MKNFWKNISHASFGFIFHNPETDSTKNAIESQRKTKEELKNFKKEMAAYKNFVNLLNSEIAPIASRVQNEIEQSSLDAKDDAEKRNARGTLEIKSLKNGIAVKSWGKSTEVIALPSYELQIKNSNLTFSTLPSDEERLVRVCNFINFTQSDYFLSTTKPVLKKNLSENPNDTWFFEIGTGSKSGNIVYFPEIENDVSKKSLLRKTILQEFFPNENEQLAFVSYLNSLYSQDNEINITGK